MSTALSPDQSELRCRRLTFNTSLQATVDRKQPRYVALNLIWLKISAKLAKKPRPPRRELGWGLITCVKLLPLYRLMPDISAHYSSVFLGVLGVLAALARSSIRDG